MAGPRSIYALDRDALAARLASMGQPRYRADQVWEWLYRHHVTSIDAMTNLPLAVRRDLGETVSFDAVEPVARTTSGDGQATKVLFRLADGQHVETVLMHYVDPADEATDDGARSTPGRHTVCLSTQVGCAMGCVFCATGQMGLVRDLTVGECMAQIVWCARRLRPQGERLTNVVFMGMGEPLANWPATWATVERLTDPRGFGLSPRRITISTVGIVPGIRRLAATGKPVRLAVSLHAPDNALRDRLVGINRTYGLDAIVAACREVQARGGRRITFEYVLIRDVNDAPEQATRLAGLLRGLRAHVNLIPLNPTAGSPMRPSRKAAVRRFAEALRAAGVPTTARLRRGIDIQAGCGQLRTRAAAGRVGRTVTPP